jgi:hypothetical protein
MSRGLSVCLVLAVTTLGILAGSPDWAAGTPVFLSQFNGSGIGASLSHPAGVAVDTSVPAVSGNVFLADGGTNNVVDLFGSSGGLPSDGLSTQLSDGFAFGTEPVGLAVDDSGGASNGDLYVADIHNNVIDKFRLNGTSYEYVCQITGFGSGCNSSGGSPLQTFSEPTGIAVDSHGNVYVADFGNEVIDEFNETGTDIRQIRGKAIHLGNPGELALDAQGDLYVQQFGGGKVLKFDANLLGEVESETEPTVVDGGQAFGVAVDIKTGIVYVAHKESVVQYGSGGAPEGTFGAGVIGEATSVAANATTGEIYVADAAHDDVAVFGPAPPQPPRIDSEYARDVTATAALLTAQVNARAFDTHCYFEYGLDTSYSSVRTPVPPGVDIGSGGSLESDRAVEASLQGLTPGTTYHYRVVTENSNGEVAYGLDHEITTFPPKAPFSLPDGRAWEMVSPSEKNNGDVQSPNSDSGGGLVQASGEGNAIAFLSFEAFAGAKNSSGGNQYLASRTANGWLTQSLGLSIGSQTYHVNNGAPYKALSSDLSSGLLLNGSASAGAHGVGAHGVENPPPEGSEAPAGYENFYLNRFASNSFEALLTSKPAVPPEEFGMELLGATPDLKHVVIESEAALAPGVTEEAGIARLYESAAGKFYLVSALPGAHGGLPDDHRNIHIGSELPDPRAVSEDGSRVIWTALGAGGGLYVREAIGTPEMRTVQLDSSHGGPEEGGGEYLTASANGEKVFFVDHRQLTQVKTDLAGEGLGDLYEFRLESGNAEGGRLTDLTSDQVDPGGAAVLGVLGEGESATDGTYVYFVAAGKLSGANSEGHEPEAGADNLYVLHEDSEAHTWETEFIATLSPDDNRATSIKPAPGEAQDWTFDAGVRTARVTPDGTHLVFMSNNPLTGYDNTVSTGASCGSDESGHPLPAQCEEVFLYDATARGDRLHCVSCNPSSERPLGPSGIPGGTDFAPGRGIYESRVISEDGERVFFESNDALVAQGTNGTRNVYEYEGGYPYLISSNGGGETNASFVDASANGDDVFFITATPLVPQDTDQLVDLYDARAPHIPGETVGFNAAGVPIPCGGEQECRPPSNLSSSSPGEPSSATFSGPASIALTPLVTSKSKVKKIKSSKYKKKKKRTVNKSKRRRGRTGRSIRSLRKVR